MDGGRFLPVRNVLLNFIFKVEANKRLRLLLSEQLEISSLKVGEDVLIVDENDSCSLMDCTIKGFDGGFVITNAGKRTIDKIFDLDYTESNLKWMTDRLDEKEKGKSICFNSGHAIQVGCLKWKGEIPWEEKKTYYGIKVLTGSVEHEENDSQFIYHRKIVDNGSTIITEDQLITDAEVKVLANDGQDVNGRFHGRGSLWVKDGLRYHCLDDDGEMDGGRFLPVRNELVNFIFKVEANKRLRLLLSQQLETSSLEVGEKIRVAVDDNLVRCKIVEVQDGLVNATECADDEELSEFPDEDRDRVGPVLDYQDERYKYDDFEHIDNDKEMSMPEIFHHIPDERKPSSREWMMRKENFRNWNIKRKKFQVPLHNVYDDDYIKRRDMKWTADVLGETGYDYERDQMIYFKTDRTDRHSYYSGGVLKYMLKPPWHDQLVFVIERCIDDGKFTQLLKPDLVNFSFVYFDSQREERVIVSEDQILDKSELVVARSEWSREQTGETFEKGSIWIHAGDKVFLFDGEVDFSAEREFDVIPDYHAHLMFAVDEDLRIPFLSLEQLGESKLAVGDSVLVAPARSQNPNDLEKGNVKDVRFGMIAVQMQISIARNVTADRVYHKDFLKKSLKNIHGKERVGDVVFFDRKEKRYRLGSPLWIASLPWEKESVSVIECFSEFYHELVVREEKPVYFHFKYIGNARNTWEEVREEYIYELSSVQIYLLSGRSERGIHCELHHLLGYEDPQKIEKSEISNFQKKSNPLESYHSTISHAKITFVPNALVRYISRIPQNILRLRFLMSNQLNIKNLCTGKPVLIDCGTEKLEEANIESVENGLILVEGGQVVTIDKVFDIDYCERDHEWKENLLETQTKETYEKGDIVTFVQGNGILVGVLKWKGSVPWLESHLIGIECIKKISDDNSERCSGRMIHFVPVMDTDEEYSIIVEENEVQKAEVVILQEECRGFDIGTLWSKQESKIVNIENDGEIDVNYLLEGQTSSIPSHLLPFVLKICPNERRKVLLSGQLHNLQLQQEEEVFVVKDPSKVTGNPIDLLERTKITKVSKMDIEVEKFGKVEIGRIFVSSYFSDGHSWTDNYLGKAGYLQVIHDKEVYWRNDGKEMSGIVKWFGKVPWEDRMLVGICTTDEIECEGDFDGRYLHFLQLLHSEKNRSIIIPENLIDDNSLDDPVQSPFARKELDDFPIDCGVSWTSGTPLTWFIGTVKWTGEYFCTFDTPLAVVVLNKRHDKGTSGRFMGITLVHCQQNRALLMSVKLLNRIPNLEIGDCVEFLPPAQGPKCSAVVKWLEPDPKQKKKLQQLIGIQLKKRHKKAIDVKDKFECPDGYGMIVPVYKLTKAKEQDSVIENPVPPISSKNSKDLIGENRGIQGFNNSCYLDTILFSMFAFTSTFEDRIPKGDPDIEEGKNLLLNGIVYPLRKHMYVPFSKTTSLRQLLAELSGEDAYLSRTRDIPECLEILFGKVLDISPWIRTIANNMNMSSYHTEIFPFINAKGIATSQLYLEYSAMFMDFRFFEKPNTLILQLQRQGNHNPKPMVPSLYLDLTACMANYRPRLCSICKSKDPGFRVDSRFDMKGLESTFVCSDCASSYPYSTRLSDSSTSTSAANADYMMNLTAVICIESSHYNCFVRCGDEENDDWIFFDSMADQTPTGENIPKIIPVDLSKWIKNALKSEGEINPKSYYHDKSISERPFVHPYALIYQS